MKNIFVYILLLYSTVAFALPDIDLNDRFVVRLYTAPANYVHKIEFDTGDSSIFRASLSDGADLIFTTIDDTTTQIYHAVAEWDTNSNAATYKTYGLIYLPFESAITDSDSVYCYIGCSLTDTTFSAPDSLDYAYGARCFRQVDSSSCNSLPSATPLTFTHLTRAAYGDTCIRDEVDSDGRLPFNREFGNVFIDSTDPDTDRRYKAFYSGNNDGNSDSSQMCLWTSPDGLPGNWTTYADAVSDSFCEDPITIAVNWAWGDTVVSDSVGWFTLGETPAGSYNELGAWWSSESQHCTTTTYLGRVFLVDDTINTLGDNNLQVGSPASPAFVPVDYENDTLFCIIEDGIATPVRGVSTIYALKSNLTEWFGYDTLAFRGTNVNDTWDKGAQVPDQVLFMNDTTFFSYHSNGADYTGHAFSRKEGETIWVEKGSGHTNSIQCKAFSPMFYQGADSIWYAISEAENSATLDGLVQWRLCTVDTLCIGNGWEVHARQKSGVKDDENGELPVIGNVDILDGELRVKAARWINLNNMTALTYTGSKIPTGYCLEIYMREQPIAASTQRYLQVAWGDGYYVDYQGSADNYFDRSGWQYGYHWNRQSNVQQLYCHNDSADVTLLDNSGTPQAFFSDTLLTFIIEDNDPDSLFALVGGVKNTYMCDVENDVWADSSFYWMLSNGAYQGNYTSIFYIKSIIIRPIDSPETPGNPQPLEEGEHRFQWYTLTPWQRQTPFQNSGAYNNQTPYNSTPFNSGGAY